MRGDSLSADRRAAQKERFRWWVILLGAALIPVNSLWIARTEAMDYSGFPTCASLFFNVIFSLMMMLVLNTAVRRFVPHAALGRRELLVVYGMLATGSSLVGHDCMQMLVPSIPHVSHFGTPENQWPDKIAPLLPDWLTIPADGGSVTAYERGRSTLYLWEHIRVWVTPVAAWSVFLLAMIACMLSINVILRRHWAEHERLTYPIAQIPLLITENGGANELFRGKLFWIGFGIAAGLDMWNGLAQLYPSVPMISLKLRDIGYLFSGSRPWSAIGWTPISFYPFVIGLSFFMPTNIAFSSWFFFFFRKGQQVASAALGYSGGDPWFPYLKEQAYGAWIALILASLWFGRGYLKHVWQAAWHGRGQTDDGGVSYRGAMAALTVGLLVLLFFLVIAGMTPWIAVLYVCLYTLFCAALTRLRAELGPPAHELGYVGTSHVIVLAFGTTALGAQNLALFSLLHFQNRMHRGLLMPQQAESLYAAGVSGLRIRTMVIALAVAGVVGVLSAFWALMHLGYGRTYAAAFHPGAPGSAFATEAYNVLMSWLNTPTSSDWMGIAAVGIGAGVTMALARCSTLFYGFPFHPAGYALGMAFGLDYIWLPVMISWLAKVLILRYCGLKGYRVAMPFFVGLVLGEFAVGGMWSFVRGVLGVQTYTFFY